MTAERSGRQSAYKKEDCTFGAPSSLVGNSEAIRTFSSVAMQRIPSVFDRAANTPGHAPKLSAASWWLAKLVHRSTTSSPIGHARHWTSDAGCP